MSASHLSLLSVSYFSLLSVSYFSLLSVSHFSLLYLTSPSCQYLTSPSCISLLPLVSISLLPLVSILLLPLVSILLLSSIHHLTPPSLKPPSNRSFSLLLNPTTSIKTPFLSLPCYLISHPSPPLTPSSFCLALLPTIPSLPCHPPPFLYIMLMVFLAIIAEVWSVHVCVCVCVCK